MMKNTSNVYRSYDDFCKCFYGDCEESDIDAYADKGP
jgi:hypothetical protein